MNSNCTSIFQNGSFTERQRDSLRNRWKNQFSGTLKAWISIRLLYVVLVPYCVWISIIAYKMYHDNEHLIQRVCSDSNLSTRFHDICMSLAVPQMPKAGEHPSGMANHEVSSKSIPPEFSNPRLACSCYPFESSEDQYNPSPDCQSESTKGPNGSNVRVFANVLLPKVKEKRLNSAEEQHHFDMILDNLKEFQDLNPATALRLWTDHPIKGHFCQLVCSDLSLQVCHSSLLNPGSKFESRGSIKNPFVLHLN